ncbi:hypothetical protein SARC_07403 [Sphaeroforma arctica JP610]|uniref:Mot1 central domain-containing protein n=1 Tax=Sphaeroforma arctica JP610 TaxID=667725 RepID=A0A0L0FU97_9EUKA|nr:hypothetical protein SARC_07403 [Sphaeroforma arctica JP610]KNC80239.1 hypothetical protein SARC_07403 [Sphaeroforma arctica JP610]|eukprot:XP_014154141.1 hypothetical protein SARC_07403 [Sphaeroforma arctica JP610]
MLDLQSSAGDLDIGVNDLEEDVVKVEEIKVEDTVAANEIADKLQGLTARERLRLKRLAKGKRSAALKVKSSKSKTDANAAVGASTGGNVGTDLIEAAEPVVEVNPNEWPFENLCDELRHDLFDAEWEVRHGAGSALRDVIKTHGSGGGKVKGALPNQNAENHNRWLEDIAIRLLCIFALDKFSDFGSDQAVAPVRETCAQSLGALLPYMDAALVARVLSELLHLLEQDKWEVRHGGLLGVKYILAVRSDLAEQLLPTVLPAILGGLIDDDDDVRAVAAEAARPIVDVICAHEASKVSELLSILWDTLSDLDDLTASTSSVLSLLAELLSHKDVMLINERDPDALTSLVPKLFPFFRHSTTAVRKATLRCLSMVIGNVTPLSELEPGRAPPTRQWLEPILPLMVKHLFQNMLLEEKPAITELNNEVWTTVLALIPTDNIKSVTQGHLQPWLTLLVTPMGGNFNEAYLVLPPKARVDRKMKGKDKKRATDSVAAVDVSRGPRMPLDPCEATRLRLCGCRALAEVALKWPGDESAALIQALQQMIDSNSNVQRIVAATIISDWMGLWTHRGSSAKTQSNHPAAHGLHQDRTRPIITRKETRSMRTPSRKGSFDNSLFFPGNSNPSHSSAKAIAALFDIVRTRTPCPIPKITKNLCASACADVKVVPVVGTPSAAEINKDDPEDSDHRFHSIYTLQLKTYEANSTAGPGRKSKQPMAEVVDDDVKLLRAQANGGRLALQQITKYSGPNLFTTLPNFWPQLTDNIVTGLQQGYKDQPMDDGSIQPLVNGLYATKMVIPALDPVYHPQVLDLLPYLINGLGHPYKAVRYMCATAVAAICQTVGLDALIIDIHRLPHYIIYKRLRSYAQ